MTLLIDNPHDPSNYKFVVGAAGTGWVPLTDADKAQRQADIDAMLVLPPVPSFVTNYQARAALINAGLFETVEAAVESSPDKMMVQAWRHAGVIQRSSPFIASMSAALGLTNEQVDDLFRAASAIS
jgi:hypothetical protein